MSLNINLGVKVFFYFFIEFRFSEHENTVNNKLSTHNQHRVRNSELIILASANSVANQPIKCCHAVIATFSLDFIDTSACH